MAKSDIVVKIVYRDNPAGLNKSKKRVGQFSKSLKSLGLTAVTGAAAFAGFGTASDIIGNAVQSSIEFEKSLSRMRSMVGATAQDLEYYKKQAIDMGKASGMSASDVVQAFQLVGSKRPELLKNKEAMMDVTQAAITLSHASGDDLETSVNALTMSLGQFGAQSSEAGNYINVLAAASQEGAAEVPYLTAAIEKSGGTANMVGLSFAQLVASIEAVAPKVSDASTAGLGLKNVLILLERQTDDKLKPSVVGYNQALSNLADRHLSITQMVKLFGSENVAVAQALIGAKDECLRLQKAIVGTNTAQEQAKINNDNVAGSVERLKSTWGGFTLRLNQSNGAIKSTINWLTQMIDRVGLLLTSVDQLNRELSEGKQKQGVSQANENINKRMAGGMSRKQATQAELAYQRQQYAQAQREIDAYNQRYTPEERGKQKQAYQFFATRNKNGMGAINYAMNGLSFGVLGNRSAAYEGYLNALQRRQVAGKVISSLKSGGVSVSAPKDTQVTPPPASSSSTGSRSTSAQKAKNYAEGSLGELEQRISRLQEQYRTVTTDAARAQIGAQLDAAEAQRKAMERTTAAPPAAEGSLRYYEEQIRALREELELAVSDSVRQDLQRKIDELDAVRDRITDDLNKKDEEPKYSGMNAGVMERADQYDEALRKVQEYDRLIKVAHEDERARLEQERAQWQAVADAIGGSGEAMSSMQMAQQAADQVMQLGGALQQMGSALGVNMSGFGKFMSILQATMSVISAVQSVTGFLGETFGTTANSSATLSEASKDEAKQGAAAAAASAVKSGAYALESKAAEKAAAANIFLAHSYIPFAGVPMATGFVATMEGVLGGLQAFADGGIVGGSSWHGDRVLARLNSGEMVLNQGQQRKLFGMISQGGGRQDGGGTGGSRTVVTGEQIVTVINNYARRKGRGEVISL
jgi:hypothetical protein